MALYGSPCEEQGCLAAWLSDLDLCRNSPATLPMQLTAGWVKTWRFCRFRRWILTDKTGRWTQSAPVNLLFLICSPKKCSWKSLSPAMEWLYWLLEFVFGGDPAWRTSSRCWEWAFHSTEVSNLTNAGEVSSASCTHNSQHLSQMQVFGNNATNTHHKCLVLSYQFWLFLLLWSNSCTFSTFLVQKLPYMKHANLYQGNPFSAAEIGGAQHSSTSGHCFVNLEDVELNGHQTSGE